MRNIELSAIRARISGLATKSPVADNVADIIVESEDGDETGGFLRVVVELKTFKGVADNDLLNLITAIEDDVLHVDDRYPSVRFSEAA